MARRTYLQAAAALSLVSFVLLIAAAAITLVSGGRGAQEQFEFFYDPAKYTAALLDAGDWLRIVLTADDLFILAYIGALGFAAAGFMDENPMAAWAAFLGIFAVATLDFWENAIIGTSADMAAAGIAIDAPRIAYQVAVSAAKWNAGAFALLALSFAIPKERFFETFLAWAIRLVFPLATALFVAGPAGARQVAVYGIYAGMLSGFALLAIAAYGRSRDGLRQRIGF